jgi:hypothetical protein
MKTFLMTIAALVLASGALAGQHFDAVAWRNVQTYEVPTLLKEEASFIGRIVAVRFNYRSEKLRHLQPNWYEASLWQRDPKAKNGFSALRVMVAKEDLEAFQTITSDFRSGAQITAYGRVERDPEANFIYLRLLGRKVVMDAAGNPTVVW